MPSYLGIDVRQDEVRVAVVKTAYRKMSVHGLACVPLQVGSPETGGTEAREEAVRAAVGSALGRVAAGDGMAVAIAGDRAPMRTVQIPRSASKQLAEVLPFELEAVVPFELDETVFDFHELTLAPSAEGSMAVGVVLAKTEDVKRPIDLMKRALGAEPERVSAGAFPVVGLLPYVLDLPSDPIAILDIGFDATEVVVVHGEEVVFARTLSIGTSGLPEKAATLAREVRLSFNAHVATGGTLPVRLFLTGPGAYVSGAEAFLSAELLVKVSILGGFSFELEPGVSQHLPDLAKFARAIGLAFSLTAKNAWPNLRRGPLAFERGFDWLKERAPVLAGYGAAIVGCLLLSLIAQSVAVSGDRRVYENALAKVTKDVLGKEMRDAIEATDVLSKQVGSPDEDPLPHADAFDVMVKLSDVIPSTMVHDIEELDVQKGHVVVRGIVGSIPDAEAIVKSLQNERCFSDVKRGRTSQQPGSDRQKYVMEFDIKCPEDVKGGTKKKDASGSASAAASASGGKP